MADHMYENKYLSKKWDFVIGVDEAGRGPLAGPVMAAAFCFEDLQKELSWMLKKPWSQINDSKQLNEAVREEIFSYITDRNVASVLEHQDGTTSFCFRSEICDDDDSVDTADTAASSEDPEPGIPVDIQVPSESPVIPAEIKIPVELPENLGASLSDADTGNSAKGCAPVLSCWFASAEVSPKEIDALNILEATMLGMSRAVMRCCLALRELMARDRKISVKILVDGTQIPQHLKLWQDYGLEETCPVSLFKEFSEEWDELKTGIKRISCEAVTKGDSKVYSIGAASVVAKVVRDRLMNELDLKYPQYNLAQHKGYPTPSHKKAVLALGPSAVHRFSFEPCQRLILEGLFPIPDGRSQAEVDVIKARLQSRKKRKRYSELDSETTQPAKKLKFNEC